MIPSSEGTWFALGIKCKPLIIGSFVEAILENVKIVFSPSVLIPILSSGIDLNFPSSLLSL